MSAKIKNFNELAVNENRKIVLEIANTALVAIDTQKNVRERVRLEDGKLCIKDYLCSLDKTRKIFVIGAGKCAMEAASGLEEILGDRLEGGIVMDVHESHRCVLKKIECFIGTHPLPSEKNIEVTQKIVALLKELKEEDLVIFIISGGGSTLLCLPDEGADCLDEKLIVGELIKKGADIREINTIRKHMSLARGGYLAKYAYPAQVISLIFSDVSGSDMEFVASGPTIKDTTTINDADEILAKYEVLRSCGLSHCGLIETPKEDIYFKKVNNILFMTNQIALEAIKNKAGEMGFSAQIVTDKLSGEAREVGEMIANELNKSNNKTMLVYGGETTVTVKKPGKGGRNQELTLAALSFIKENEIILALNTDGWDNSDHAGALCDIITKEKVVDNNIIPKKFLDDNLSYDFFEITRDYLETGYTGSNVSDLIIALKNNGQ